MSARAIAFQVLSQLGHDQSSMTPNNEELEMGDVPTAISHIESIKFTWELIEEIRTTTFKNGNLDDDVIYHLHNPLEEPTSLSDPDI